MDIALPLRPIPTNRKLRQESLTRTNGVQPVGQLKNSTLV